MAIITLNGITYIMESVGDETIPAHNYDDVIDVSKSEDPDQWFGRVQAEWPSLPEEIKNKVIDSTGQYIGQLSQQAGIPAAELDPNKPLEEAATGEDPMASVYEDAKKKLPAFSGSSPRRAYAEYLDYLDEADWDAILRVDPNTFETAKAEGLIKESQVQDGNGEFINAEFTEKGLVEYMKYISTSSRASAPIDEAKDSTGNDVYDFAEGKAKIQAMNDDALAYTRNDIIEAIKAQEDMKKQGYNVPKLGYYWDEYWTVVDEIARRIKAGSQFDLAPWALNGAPVDDKIEELGE